MRKGFTLVEMLAVILILPIVLVALDGLFTALLTDVPWSYRVTQENTTLLNMLAQLQEDVDRATDVRVQRARGLLVEQAEGLPESFSGNTANDELLIESAEGVICYQLRHGEMLRCKLADARQNKAEDTRVWSLPNANVVWKVWARDGRGYAVEADAYIEYRKRGRFEKKMANSHLYFVGALGKELR